MWGLTKATYEGTGKTLAGVGFWTIDGFLHQAKGKKERFWYKDICEMNSYYHIPCDGECCPSRGIPSLLEPIDDQNDEV